MGFNLGDLFPDFRAETTEGPIEFHQWKGDAWAMLFSHPADFTPVCTTELGRAAALAPEFEKRGVRLIALSIDSLDDHRRWIEDIKAYNKLDGKFPYPIIADESRELATQFGMLDPAELHIRTGVPAAARCVFLIGPDNKLKLSILYPATTGRNFAEILRVVDSLQLTAKHSVATPADWKAGDTCMVTPNLTDDEAKARFVQGFETAVLPSGKGYVRVTPQPQ